MTPEERKAARQARLEERALRQGERSRAVLLRRDANRVDELAARANGDFDVIRAAHRARMKAIKDNPGLSTVEETAIIVEAVQKREKPTKPESRPEVLGKNDLRKQMIQEILDELGLPDGRTAQQVEYADRLRLKMKRLQP